MSTKKGSKKAFDFARNTMWSPDPLDLCIIGGKKIAHADERGLLDTDDGPDHTLWDARILDPLDEGFLANITVFGVDSPIVITKINGVAVVIAGKTRVRAARRANKKRKAAGEPLIKIDCKMKRDSEIGLLGAMIHENEARRNDDVLAKIDKLKRFLNKGGSIEDAALRYGVGTPTIKGWLAYDDNALTDTKKAVESGKISQTAGATLARISDPAQQKKALAEMLLQAVNGRTSTRAARIAAEQTGAGRAVGVADKKTQKRLLESLQNMGHANAGKETTAYYQGGEDMLKLIMGDEDADPRFKNKLDEIYSLIKTENRASARGGKRRVKKGADEAAAN